MSEWPKYQYPLLFIHKKSTQTNLNTYLLFLNTSSKPDLLVSKSTTAWRQGVKEWSGKRVAADWNFVLTQLVQSSN